MKSNLNKINLKRAEQMREVTFNGKYHTNTKRTKYRRLVKKHSLNNDNGKGSKINISRFRLLLQGQKFTSDHKKIEHLLKKTVLTNTEKNQVETFLKRENSTYSQWIGYVIEHQLTDQQCLATLGKSIMECFENDLKAVSDVEEFSLQPEYYKKYWKQRFLHTCLVLRVSSRRVETLLHNTVPKQCLELVNLYHPGQISKTLNSIHLRNHELSHGSEKLVVEAYSGLLYHGLCNQNLQRTIDITALPGHLVHRALKENAMLSKTDCLKFCPAIPFRKISGTDYDDLSLIYVIEIHSTDNKEFQIGITENVETYIERVKSQSNVYDVVLHTVIDCTNNPSKNSSGKRKLEAYFIQQTILALFQPYYIFSSTLDSLDEDDTDDDDFYNYSASYDSYDFYDNINYYNYEFLNSQAPINLISTVMKTLANAVDQ